ncbi:YebC/PmpR family DNA-binding transcriptional regulator [Calycomorphotria hydatis]|uniref:Probable transcriptional regulatory protein V22_34460 n=1 Tax=Calycomorphotria hydatis TaxID=2528027 RepID=A0A517TCT7_9PLAN|nr:YebC/PmpR family DNA-binding transcriptional regulator [Calycomorphotria hydatis]QDT66181.1 putative transcriptional regulatory protein [Calycomorphotria hydatis]
MAGHSHWANIARKKGAVDKQRGKLFGKLSRAIIVAARNGGGDPAMNLRLRYAIDKARKASMPNDNIDRAVKKGCGDLDGESFEELLYEGYGAGGTAVMCDILTDNRNRTASEVRKIFEVHGGNLGSTNCVAWMFDRKGVITVSAASMSEEQLFEQALEAGAEDVKSDGEYFSVYTSPDIFQDVCTTFEEAGIPTESTEISWVPQNTVDLDVSDGRKVLNLLEALEEQDDIQSVTANFNLPDDVMAALESE